MKRGKEPPKNHFPRRAEEADKKKCVARPCGMEVLVDYIFASKDMPTVQNLTKPCRSGEFLRGT